MNIKAENHYSTLTDIKQLLLDMTQRCAKIKSELHISIPSELSTHFSFFYHTFYSLAKKNGKPNP